MALALLAGAAGAVTVAAEAAGVLSLSGRISEDLTYRVRVDYATTVNDQSCKFDDQITGMWVPRVESRYYRPAISGRSHALQIEATWPGEPDGCGWAPKAAFLCVGPRAPVGEPANCRPLLIVSAVGGAQTPEVNLVCSPKYDRCLTADGKDPVRLVDRFEGPMQLNIDEAAATR